MSRQRKSDTDTRVDPKTSPVPRFEVDRAIRNLRDEDA